MVYSIVSCQSEEMSLEQSSPELSQPLSEATMDFIMNDLASYVPDGCV